MNLVHIVHCTYQSIRSRCTHGGIQGLCLSASRSDHFLIHKFDSKVRPTILKDWRDCRLHFSKSFEFANEWHSHGAPKKLHFVVTTDSPPLRVTPQKAQRGTPTETSRPRMEPGRRPPWFVPGIVWRRSSAVLTQLGDVAVQTGHLEVLILGQLKMMW